ncbi:uncharacterized protein C11orf52 homolog isoform X3 [Dasypus novemcinctus]|uniref:uncharacterized protein C11orf52 homolog isoform X3 n=1 Tax=Dasypus novemcinctus TaxID=9361 RepID=UPI00265DA3B7|nr:uncharacterized protein C11orf52 homolog isoform X3 [Dasypus novemcinctus]
MGNRLCCGESWKHQNQTWNLPCVRSCPPHVRRKKKTGSQARQPPKQQPPPPQQQNGTKGPETPGHTYEQVLEHPKSQDRRSPGLWPEESNLYYADIQVCSRTQPRSVRGMKHLRSENTTEYATLRFPRATPHYDSKNGTLV